MKGIPIELDIGSIGTVLARYEDEVTRLRECLMHALNYRPLPTDPLQLFVKERCPDVIEQWEKMRKVNE